MTRLEYDRLERALEDVPFHLMNTWTLALDCQRPIKYIREREEDYDETDHE